MQHSCGYRYTNNIIAKSPEQIFFDVADRIKSGANVTLNGYNSVRIVPGFTAEAGSTVRIYNGKSSKSMANEYRAPEYEATNMDLLNIETPYLRQNIPNPFADETILSCFIPENAISSYIQINGILGNIIKKIPITLRGENQVLINGRDRCPILKC